MIRWQQGEVERVVARWPGAVELEVSVGDAILVPALALEDLVGRPEVGDRVLLNTVALERGLGTGGLAHVVAMPDRLPPDPPQAPGHLVKARYTPLQTMVLGVDDQESPHHPVLEDADELGGMPVVVADLHSSLPAVVIGVRERAPGARVAYVMTDGGALPAAFSRTCAGLREAGWLTAVLTAGQAFGGDHEAVTVHTALLAARHVVGADVVVVAQGPGNLGTGTRWGFSGVSAGEAINAGGVLGGRPVAALRVSEADPRARHRGVSHHSRTAYGRVACRAADLVVPQPCDQQVDRQAGELVASASHLRRVDVPTDGLLAALAAGPVRLSTMGRSLTDDPSAFLAAAAAGRHAADLLAVSTG